MDVIGRSHPSPRRSPREGRGRHCLPSRMERVSGAFPLSPQRGEGRGEGCDQPRTVRPERTRTSGRRLIAIGLLCVAAIAHPAFAQTVFINEVMSSNGGTLLDENGDSSDWIELY